MNKYKKQKNNCIENIVVAVGLLLLGYLFVINIIFNTSIAMNSTEIPVISYGLVQALLLIFGSILMFWIIDHWIDNVNSNMIFFTGLVIHTLFAMYLIFNIDHIIRADAASVYNGAILMSEGDYSALSENGYFFYYPHQLGLATYNSLINLISKELSVHFVINFCMLVLLYIVMWKSTKLMFREEEKNTKLVCVLMFLFYPALLFVIFLYGHTPGYLCVMSAFYFFIRKERRLGNHNDILIIGLLILACTIRNNYMIAAIAIAICYVLSAFKTKKWHLIVLAMLIVTTFSLGSNIVKGYYENKSGIEINEGIPKVLWVTMGMQDIDTGYCMGGWWNSYTVETYQESGFDEEIASDVGKADLIERIRLFKQHPRYTFRYFTKKIVSTWTEPTYQSIWSGPLEDCGQTVKTRILKSIYSEGKLFELLNIFGKMLTISIYIGTISFYIIKKAVKKETMFVTYYFPIIYLSGGFLFHMIWETKSQYVWTYVYSLIPLAGYGWKELINLIKRRLCVSERGIH